MVPSSYPGIVDQGPDTLFRGQDDLDDLINQRRLQALAAQDPVAAASLQRALDLGPAVGTRYGRALEAIQGELDRRQLALRSAPPGSGRPVSDYQAIRLGMKRHPF